MADAADGRAFEATQELVLAPAQQLDQIRGIQAVAGGEVGQGGAAREAIPGTHQLAVVTAVDAVADQGAQRFGDGAAQFDGEVGDAAPRVELARAGDGPGGADVDAGGATAAVIALLRRVHRQRQVGEQFAEEEPGAGVAGDEVGVLADPAQPGLLGQGLFQHRRAVDEGAVAERPDARLDAPGELLQAPAHELMVVAAQGIARDVSEAGIAQYLMGRAAVRRQVVHAYRDNAPRARHQLGRSRAPQAVPCHVVHLAMPARRQPALQMGFVLGQVGVADAERIEAQLRRPGTDLLQQLFGVGQGHGQGV